MCPTPCRCARALADVTFCPLYHPGTGPGRRWLLAVVLALALGLLAVPPAHAQWNGAKSGATEDSAHNYLLASNWEGSTINDSFAGFEFSGPTALYLLSNRTTVATGLNLNYVGNIDLTIREHSMAVGGRTLTLNGDIFGDFGGASNNRTVNIFLSEPGFTAQGINLNGNRKFTVASGDTLTIGSYIFGTGHGLTVDGPGTVHLTFNNTYTGGTTISAGTLRLGGSDPLQGNIANSSSLVFESDSAQTFGGAISGTGTLTKGGSGTLTLTGSNSYTGGTTFTAGTLQVGSVDALGSSGTLTFSGGTLQYSAANTTDYSNRFSSAINQQYRIDTNGQNVTLASNLTSVGGSLAKLGAGTVTLTGTNSYTGGTTISAGTLRLGNASALPNDTVLTLGAGTSSGRLELLGFQPTVRNLATSGSGTGNAIVNGSATAVALTVTSTADTTYAGLLGGPGLNENNFSLVKQGAGTLTLTGANTYTGDTTISAGTLKLQGGAFWTTARSYSIASGAVLNLDGNTGVASGTTTIAGQGTLRITGANSTFGNESPNSPAGSGRNIAMQLGAGALIDVQLGAKMVNGGWQNITWQNIAGTSNLASLNVNGIFDVWDGNTVQVNALTGSGQVQKNLSGGTVEFVVGADNGSGTFAGVISNSQGAIALRKTGSGTQMLTGANTYTGGTTISAGTLQIGGGGTTGSVSGNIANDDSALIFNYGSGASISYAGNVSGSGSLTKLGAGTLTLTGANTYTGDTTISAGTLKLQGTAFSNTARSYSIASDAVLNLDGDTGVAAGETVITGAGTLRITGGTFGNFVPNVWGHSRNILMGLDSGALIDVQSGAMMVNGAHENIYWGHNRASLNVNGIFEVFQTSVRVNALTGSGQVQRNQPGATIDLVLGVDNGSGTFAGVISNGVSSIALVKVGSGTQTLSGANTYSGGTTISGGTLEVRNNSALGTGPLTLNGGTLSGNNTVAVFLNNAVVVNAVAGNGLTTPGGVGQFLWLNGNLSGSGNLTASGSDAVQLNSSNNSAFTGTYTNASGKTFFRTTGSSLSAGTLDITGGLVGARLGVTGTIALGALSGTGGELGNRDTPGTATFAIGSLNTTTSFGGVIKDSVDGATGTNVTALTKVGTGTLTLTGNNTYSGGTTINGGRLLVNNTLSTSGTGTGAVTVNSTGTLGGTGQIAGAVTANGTIQPGDNRSGTLTVANGVTFASGSTFAIGITDGDPTATQGGSSLGTTPNFSTNTFLHQNTMGTLSISSGTNVAIDGTGAFSTTGNYSYVVALGMNIANGNLVADQARFTTIGFNAQDFLLTANANVVYLNFTVTAVPEPSQLLLLSAVVVGLVGARCRRRSIPA